MGRPTPHLETPEPTRAPRAHQNLPNPHRDGGFARPESSARLCSAPSAPAPLRALEISGKSAKPKNASTHCRCHFSDALEIARHSPRNTRERTSRHLAQVRQPHPGYATPSAPALRRASARPALSPDGSIETVGGRPKFPRSSKSFVDRARLTRSASPPPIPSRESSSRSLPHARITHDGRPG